MDEYHRGEGTFLGPKRQSVAELEANQGVFQGFFPILLSPTSHSK